MIAGSACFAVMSALVRALKDLPFMEIVFLRSLLGALLIGPLLLLKHQSVLGKNKKILLIRAVSGFLALTAFYFSLIRLPLATASLINNTSPVFVAILAGILLKERAGPILAGLIASCIIGMALLVEPGAHWDVLGHLIGLASAFFAAVAIISIRRLKEEHPFTVIFWYVAFSSIASLPLALKHWVPPDPRSIGLLILVGLFASVGQIWVTLSLARGPASFIAPFGYTAPVTAWFLGMVFFDELLASKALLGAALIVLSCAVLSSLEQRKAAIPHEL